MANNLVNNLIPSNKIQKDGAKVKSLLVSEDVHKMLKDYCKLRNYKIQDFVEQAVVQYMKS